jgi:protein-tyrosine-phosphatase
VVVALTMDWGDECPLVPAVPQKAWQIQDPWDMTHEHYRGVRDPIEQDVQDPPATLATTT